MPKLNYLDACHAMQTGVKLMMEVNPKPTEPKHLRVGVNIALRDLCSLIKLLIDKGVITLPEYEQAITEGMNEEVKSYEDQLRDRFGKSFTLR